MRQIAVVAVAVMAGALIAGTGTASAAASGCPVISARLGLHWPYYLSPHAAFPENSLGAIHAARLAGAGKVETDVSFSSDGVPMASHDDWLYRETGRSVYLHNVTAAVAETFRLRMEGVPGNTWMSTQRMQPLQAVLRQARADGMPVSVEIKPSSLTYAQARAVLRVFWAAGDEGAVDVRSYIPGVLAEMRRAGYWGRLTLTVTSPVRLAAKSGYWQESADWLWQGRYITAAAVAGLHAAGVRADAYTPEGASQYAHVPPGIDQVTTDNVRALRAWQAAHC
jgi:glycerophosphoryl diester phosphodiesterase